MFEELDSGLPGASVQQLFSISVLRGRPICECVKVPSHRTNRTELSRAELG